jgi:5-methylcytosine-specific restriction endonuclease McrA
MRRPSALAAPCDICGNPTRTAVCRRESQRRHRVAYYRGRPALSKAARQALVRELATEQGWECTWCTLSLPASLEDVQLDHVIPVSLDGPDDRWNRSVVHGGCNVDKGNKITARAIELAAEHGLTLPDVEVPARSAVAEFVAAARAAA